MAIIRCVCISTKRKSPAVSVGQCQATRQGLLGDVHYGRGERQVSLLPWSRAAAYFAERGEPVRYGRFGENVLAEGLDFAALRVGDRLRAGQVLLEIVAIGAGGPKSEAYQGEKVCAPLEKDFVFCKVLEEGILQENTEIYREEEK